MKKQYIIANWKMNKTPDEAREYACGLEQYLLKEQTHNTVVLCPPLLLLPTISSVPHTQFSLGVQNFYPADFGSFTGEHSLAMLRSFDTSYAIIGHSERRTLFHEDNSLIAKKLQYAVQNQYAVILCIGESMEEKNSAMTQQCIYKQLHVLSSLPHDVTVPIYIAYEPVWAIGTGVIPQEEEIAQCMYYIKKYAEEHLDNYSETMYTLYGGSVTQDNVASILQVEGVDGVLVGSASLQLQSFIAIIRNSCI